MPRRIKNADVMVRRMQAIRMKTQGHTWQQIADELGYPSPAAAYVACNRELAKLDKEMGKTIEEYRAVELEKLDIAEREVWTVLRKWQPKLNKDKDAAIVLSDPEGKEVWLDDDEATLKAIDRLLRIGKRRASLLGLMKAEKVAVDMKVRYAIEGVNVNELR